MWIFSIFQAAAPRTAWTRSRLSPACLLGVSCVLLAVPLCSRGADGTAYDQRIRAAREGHYGPALRMLDQRLSRNPQEERALDDYIVISGWARKRRDILRAYEAAGSPHTLPAAPLAAVARAYRDDQQWEKSAALFEEGIRRFPDHPEFALGKIMVLADAGRRQSAIALGRQRVRHQPGDADFRLALAYAYHMDGQTFAALHEASKAFEFAPEKGYVIQAYVSALQHARMPQAALHIAHAHPGVINAAQQRRLLADEAAQLTRVAGAASREEAARFEVADRALAQYDQLISAWTALGPSAAPELHRIRADRLQALHARMRMRDLVHDYEAMVQRGDPIPGYVLGDVASAYLYLHQPEKAAALFNRSLDEQQDRQSAGARLADQTELFYALTESGDYRRANAELDEAVSEQPVWRYVKGNPKRLPNPGKTDADLTRAMGDLYEGQSAAAQKQLDTMVDLAPDNSALRTSRAEIYRARELPRHAERDLKIAEADAPRSIPLEVGQAETAFQLQAWRQTEKLLEDVHTRAPENQAVKRLAREWAVHNMSELDVSAGRGVSTGSPVSGSHDWIIDSVLYTPPMDQNWRGFAGAGYASSDFKEGDAHSRWLRAGAQWRSRGMTAEAEVSGNLFGYGIHTGAAAAIAADLDDHWRLGGSLAILSHDTPLRALNQDITSNSIGAFVRWHGDERREWRFQLTPSRFSDGNRRLQAGMTARQRLYTTPRLTIDGLLDASASHNTRDDAPYFNPRSDLTVLPSIRLTHVLAQRYQTEWEQQLTVGAGTYRQQHYGVGGIFTAAYGQRFRYNDILDIGFTVSETSRPYDGERERDVNFVVDMTYRF